MVRAETSKCPLVVNEKWRANGEAADLPTDNAVGPLEKEVVQADALAADDVERFGEDAGGGTGDDGTEFCLLHQGINVELVDNGVDINPFDNPLHVDPIDDLVHIDPADDLVHIDMLDQGVNVDGLNDQCDNPVGDGLGQLFHPRADRIGAHGIAVLCDMTVIIAPAGRARVRRMRYVRLRWNTFRGGCTVEFEKYDNGVPSWVDMGSPDLDKAKEFYGGLFGWNCPEGAPEAGGYSVCDLDGKTVAGLGPQMDPNAPPNWLTYVNVDSVDDTIAKVATSGGMVFMPGMDVMDAGRMAIFADPLGAVIGLWQPNQHLGAQVANEPGTYCWSELITTDVAAAKAFYQAVFGWDFEDQGPPGGPPAYTEWKLGGKSIGGMMLKSPDMPAEMPSMWGVYFAVADTDATVALAQKLGATVFMEPTDIEPGRFALLCDPVGAMFSVLALKPELVP